jgi:hypothetical protein
MEQATSTTRSALDRVLQDQPLVVAAAGVLAGAALAAALPATEIEQQTLGPVGQQLSDAARRVGEQVKEAAGAAGDRLKDVADERGLTADGMKKLAKEVTGAFTDSMSGGSQQGSGGPQPGGSGSQQASSGNPGGPRGPAGPGRPY